ncbi:MAG: tetratricopeptide repeat protein [bacterium]|nr:tetratricopeptide repeat protein [bacterium]
MEEQNRDSALDRFSSGALIVLGFLLPVFFLPLAGIGVEMAKGALVAVVALVAFALWLLGRLVDGKFDIPKNLALLAGVLLGLALLVASVVSGAPSVSLVGSGFDTDTFAFFGLSFMLLFLASVFFQERSRALRFYGALMAGGALLALFHLARLFAGPEALSFGLFTNAVASPIGRWNDLSIFFGLTALLSLLSIEFLALGRAMRFLLYGALAVSLFFVALVNFSMNWLVLGVVSLIIVCYGVYANREEPIAPSLTVRKVRLPMASLLVTVLSFFLYLTGGSVGAFLPNSLGISQLEVRPSFGATLEIARKTLAESPFFGAGPNRFSSEWLMHKPEGINGSLFWNTDFNSGFGVVPDALVTSGLVGFGAWALFLAAFLYAGFRAMFNFSLSRLSRFLTVSSFLMGAYLWAFVALYVPGPVLYVLAFLMTGMLVASLAAENPSGRYSIMLLGEPRLGFVSVVLLIFLLLGSLSLGYLLGGSLTAHAYFQKSLVALNSEGSVDKTETYLGRALALSERDVYYRALSELGLIKLNNLLSQSSVPQDTLRAQFQTLLGEAIESARRATELDKTNYGNFIALGRIYEAIVPLKITGAYEAARDAYVEAGKLNPESPAILLTMARLEVANENVKKAREYIDQALEKKPNFTEAVFFLSQLEAGQGNTREAIRRTEEVSLLAPNDATVLFQLGFLKYNDRDNAGAIAAFERAIALSPNYSNAKYFLGLSYNRVGRRSDAVKQFEEVLALNPGNVEVEDILANLRAGKAPFADVPPPANTPEKRAKPPIEE